MEILNPRFVSLFSNKYSIKLHTNKNSPSFKFRVLLSSRNFDRPTGRRKSHLRKKLIEQQVHHPLLTYTLENPVNTSLPNLGISVSNPHIRDDDDASTSESANHVFQDSNGKLDETLRSTTESSPSPSPTNSSVANLGFFDTIGSFTVKPGFARVSVFCGLLLFIALNNFFRKEKGDKEEYSSLEKEMLRRKIKARMVKENSIKASLEVIQDSKEFGLETIVFKERPQLDKEELMNSIVKENSLDMGKIQEIRAMARHAREIELRVDNEPDEKPTSFDVLFPQGIQDTGNSSDVLGLDVPNIDDIAVEGKGSNLFDIEKESDGVKLRIISSVKEAREYLHKKQEPEINNLHEKASNDDVFGHSTPNPNQSWKDWKDASLGGNGDVLMNDTNSKNECVKGSDGELARANREKWMEDNFHEFEPLIEKIRGGFRNNYMVAREKVKEEVNLVSELERDENETEFEWMKDEKLREIVFQVRENELMGRDPFYLMDTQDKALFFKGLKKKVEKENEKLAHLHEYLHSNIENLDYGADGISLYDPPEKIIPRWKGPPPTTTMSQEFLDDYLNQRKALFAETLGNLDLDSKNLLEKVESKNLKSSKTVIEGSDGSIKPGKKSGKEFWQHTKKWSRGFIDSYNSENDPETKATMKDIGKDLDRWITEKEIQDAAVIMDKVPDKGKKFIAEKISKLKREMELFGPQAVVSKYSEYGDEEEIDYYWWLDLPFLLCIELYIDEDEDADDRIGFYSLEMASDLELDPKPHHIIAFEDAGDCKNLCYVIQTHMEMLGNGNAFVVPQLPKDTYREAKENGFNLTVIRKGELKLDVDQTLEEVEEKIVEIGSKMYHDKVMKSRNVDVDSIMKGVFGLKKTTNRNRNRRRLKKPTE
ncbi:hypothetical protein L1987_31090 [Smallanthus sonchifolius]|uniref:Uncharacterized protein n=1 Tax=Smallanthus sonchifolius TaxID=185202 RepID=A0ACB9I3Y6_9ASTR|nr:hypothetical protein L1987_31090 [Smallanthus sonchifolius]